MLLSPRKVKRRVEPDLQTSWSVLQTTVRRRRKKLVAKSHLDTSVLATSIALSTSPYSSQSREIRLLSPKPIHLWQRDQRLVLTDIFWAPPPVRTTTPLCLAPEKRYRSTRLITVEYSGHYWVTYALLNKPISLYTGKFRPGCPRYCLPKSSPSSRPVYIYRIHNQTLT